MVQTFLCVSPLYSSVLWLGVWETAQSLLLGSENIQPALWSHRSGLRSARLFVTVRGVNRQDFIITRFF